MSESAAASNFSVTRHWNALQIALQFLTAVPVRGPREMDRAATGLSLLYYPLVGLLLGLLLIGVSLAGQWLFSPLLAAALVVATWALLTGALHLDGLADCADAWVGGFGSRERTLELMKDPTSGPVAVVVVVSLLLVKVAAVAELMARDLVLVSLPGLLVAPVLARLSVLVLCLNTPYVRKAGLGEILLTCFPRPQAKLLCVVSVVILSIIRFEAAMVLVCTVGLTIAWLRGLMLSRLGGCTGDTLGAMIELIEVVALLALLAIA